MYIQCFFIYSWCEKIDVIMYYFTLFRFFYEYWKYDNNHIKNLIYFEYVGKSQNISKSPFPLFSSPTNTFTWELKRKMG